MTALHVICKTPFDWEIVEVETDAGELPSDDALVAAFAEVREYNAADCELFRVVDVATGAILRDESARPSVR